MLPAFYMIRSVKRFASLTLLRSVWYSQHKRKRTRFIAFYHDAARVPLALDMGVNGRLSADRGRLATRHHAHSELDSRAIGRTPVQFADTRDSFSVCWFESNSCDICLFLSHIQKYTCLTGRCPCAIITVFLMHMDNRILFAGFAVNRSRE